MKKNLFAARGMMAVLLSLATGAAVWSQPADAPEPKGDRPNGSIFIGLDLFTKRFTVKVEFTKAEPPAALDAVTPMLVPAVVKELLRQAGEALTGEDAKAPDRDFQANLLFKIAESCRAKGDFEKARTCYQQVHILTPTTRVGRLAMDRLCEVEQRLRDSAEEQDAPPGEDDPEQTFRSIRQGTIPLGLVEVLY